MTFFNFATEILQTSLVPLDFGGLGMGLFNLSGR